MAFRLTSPPPPHASRPTGPSCSWLLHKPSSHPLNGRAVSSESWRLLNLLLKGGEEVNRDTLKVCAYVSSVLHIPENISTDLILKMSASNKSIGISLDGNKYLSMMDVGFSARIACTTANSSSQYSLLMQNINALDILAGKDLVNLEREILVHIERLGALKLFYACLSSLVVQTAQESEWRLPVDSSELSVDEKNAKVVVKTRKNKERKQRRLRKLREYTLPFLTSEAGGKNSLGSGNRRASIAIKEKELSVGFQEYANLEKTRENLERESGLPVSYASWAEAAGVDEKTLKMKLQHGWYCRDTLTKSTLSLVKYIAKNYRGKRIAFADMLQAGKMGVLKGAERFDSKRGLQFSTYVQHWIKKEILVFISRDSRLIQLPVRMEYMIQRIQKATDVIRSMKGRYPLDEEIATFTGLSLAYLRLARRCSRLVGSIYQENGDGQHAKFMDFTPDPSVEDPDQIVFKQHLREGLLIAMECLSTRERQILELRYGLEDGRCKSLVEIGGLLNISKELVRKIEKTAISKLRREDVQKALKACYRG